MSASYLEQARNWIGREQRVSDVIAMGPARGLCALLEQDESWIHPGAPLPPLWHWAYLHLPAPQSLLGADGHERLGEFLPPLPFPRRMWASGRVHFLAPVPIGPTATRTSIVADVQEKHGRSGTFVLVTVRHRIEAEGRVAVDEEQQLAYLPGPETAGRPGSASSGESASGSAAHGEAPPAAEAQPAPTWAERFQPTPTALFRFSALTFNAHRIHWDRAYAQHEGYPDLVVHAPLLALLLLHGARAHSPRPATAFAYRARSALFADETVRLEGGATDVRALAPDSRVVMSGTVTWG